jgi:hypothetical protein
MAAELLLDPGQIENLASQINEAISGVVNVDKAILIKVILITRVLKDLINISFLWNRFLRKQTTMSNVLSTSNGTQNRFVSTLRSSLHMLRGSQTL